MADNITQLIGSLFKFKDINNNTSYNINDKCWEYISPNKNIKQTIFIFLGPENVNERPSNYHYYITKYCKKYYCINNNKSYFIVYRDLHKINQI